MSNSKELTAKQARAEITRLKHRCADLTCTINALESTLDRSCKEYRVLASDHQAIVHEAAILQAHLNCMIENPSSTLSAIISLRREMEGIHNEKR